MKYNNQTMHKIRNQMLISCILLLNSCSTYSNNFDCKAGTGVGCKSLSHVNKMVNEGWLGDIEESGCINCNQELPTENNKDLVKNVNKDQVIKIWFAPYEENNVQKGEQIIELVKNGTDQTRKKNERDETNKDDI